MFVYCEKQIFISRSELVALVHFFQLKKIFGRQKKYDSTIQIGTFF